MKIAFLSNFTVNTLANACSKSLKAEAYVPNGFNVWAQELVNPSSGLYEFSPDIVFLLIDGDSLGEDVAGTKNECERILGIIKEAVKKNPNIFFVVNTLDLSMFGLGTSVVFNKEPVSNIFALWDSSLSQINTGIIDLRELISRFGREQIFSKKFWYLGAMKFSSQGERVMLKEISRIVNAVVGRTKKCLILDLDNTLWGGVVGEDGISGIFLSKTGEGAVYRDFQKRIKDLKNSGLMLAIASKNNEADAAQVFNEHEDMVLSWSDFVAKRVNWDNKSSNIVSLAKELNIGLDSIVFIDDSPFEREQVKAASPEVFVPEFPQDSSLLVQWIDDIARDCFLRVVATEEDLKKTEMYIAESQRKNEQQQFSSFEQYLESLKMELTFREAGEGDLARAAQLTQKTNQFNLTVCRYSEVEIKKISSDDSCKIYLGKLSDRFGDYGKVLLAIVKIDGAFAKINVFLMSCRVMSRDVEYTMLNAVEKALISEGVSEVKTEYIPSSKNSLVADFWEKSGYELVNTFKDGKKEYKFILSKMSLRKTFVKFAENNK